MGLINEGAYTGTSRKFAVLPTPTTNFMFRKNCTEQNVLMGMTVFVPCISPLWAYFRVHFILANDWMALYSRGLIYGTLQYLDYCDSGTFPQCFVVLGLNECGCILHA